MVRRFPNICWCGKKCLNNTCYAHSEKKIAIKSEYQKRRQYEKEIKFYFSQIYNETESANTEQSTSIQVL